MKIVNESTANCPFKTLKPGDVFAASDRSEVYMVIFPLRDALGIGQNAIGLRSGRGIYLLPHTTVRRIECELNIHDS